MEEVIIHIVGGVVVNVEGAEEYTILDHDDCRVDQKTYDKCPYCSKTV